jgi:pimeloyl-ACP methyl ester carboxylesterase
MGTHANHERVFMNWLAVQFVLLLLLANLSYAAQWTFEEMNPGKLKPPPPTRDSRDTTSISGDCDGTPCGYKIHYFTSGPSRPGQKTILYIPGGPGQIVPREPERREFNELEKTFRIVYFDIRGAGLSAPQREVNNSEDKFLRAKYVVKDIEEIRKQVLRDDPWDAIYGHSAGTLFAQLYAEQFGKVTPTNPKVRVNTLILSAPISRHTDNEPFRAEKIATNLRNILTNNTDAPCPWKQATSVFGRILEIFSPSITRTKNQLQALLVGPERDQQEFLEKTNNFCFLDSTRIGKIEAELRGKLKVVQEKYGSIVFVLENHEKLIADDDKDFQREFPYPEPFFLALRKLDRFGSPTHGGSDLWLIARSMQVNAALVLGYYLDSPTARDAKSPECNTRANFLSPLFPDIAIVYCNRFDRIVSSEESPGKGRSKRAANVLGIHEGIHRWPVKLMGEAPAQCDKGSQFLAFAGSRASDKRTARKLIAQVGFQIGDEICPWNPAKHKHNVRTLILKGKEDAAVHGCQAEHFFKEGLLHADKEFVEFVDLGHDWIAEIEKKGDLATLLKKFVDGPAEFRGDDVKGAMKRLHAINRTVASFTLSGC